MGKSRNSRKGKRTRYMDRACCDWKAQPQRKARAAVRSAWAHGRLFDFPIIERQGKNWWDCTAYKSKVVSYT